LRYCARPPFTLDRLRELDPNSPLRPAVTALAPGATTAPPAPIPVPAAEPAHRRAARYAWAMLLARIYEVFPLVCPRCGGAMRIIAFITDGPTVRDAGQARACPRQPARARPPWRRRPPESATTSVRSSPLPPKMDA
jgi:hypothetical protein